MDDYGQMWQFVPALDPRNSTRGGGDDNYFVGGSYDSSAYNSYCIRMNTARIDAINSGYYSGYSSGGYYAITGSSASSNTSGKKIPNPYGKKGGIAHQSKIEEIKKYYKERGYTIESEVKIDTPNGMKPYRFADIAGTNPYTNSVTYINVGKALSSGLPCARERYAISDIESVQKVIIFYRYN